MGYYGEEKDIETALVNPKSMKPIMVLKEARKHHQEQIVKIDRLLFLFEKNPEFEELLTLTRGLL